MTWRSLVGIVGLILLTMVSAFGAENASSQWQVQLEFRVIALRLPESLPLLARIRRPDAAEADFGRLDELIAQKKAELAGYAFGNVRSGDLIVAESVEDFLSPGPPDPISGSGSGVASPMREFYSGSGLLIPTGLAWYKAGTQVVLSPTVVDTGRVIILSGTFTTGRLREWQEFHGPPSPLGIEGLTPQPVLDHEMCSINTSVLNGRPTLIGNFTLQKPSRLLALVVRAIAVPVRP